jgi:hypothetical protein
VREREWWTPRHPTATTSERRRTTRSSRPDRLPNRAEHHRTTGRLCRCRGNDTRAAHNFTPREGSSTPNHQRRAFYISTSPRRLGSAPSTREEDAGPAASRGNYFYFYSLSQHHVHTHICNYYCTSPSKQIETYQTETLYVPHFQAHRLPINYLILFFGLCRLPH